MNREFEYCQEKIMMKNIFVEDIGNCRLLGKRMEDTYILWIKTQLGITKVIQLGPILFNPDGKVDYKLWDEIECSLLKFKYNEKKINGIINSFLNFKTGIQLANMISIEELQKIVKEIDLFRFMEGE